MTASPNSAPAPRWIQSLGGAFIALAGLTISTADGAAQSTAPTERATTERAPVAGEVSVDRLAPISIDGLGNWEPAPGRSAREFWQGTERADVIARLNRLPIQSTSFVLHRVQEHLLRTAAVPPPANSAVEPGAFFQARLSGLFRSGAWEQVIDLADRVPSHSKGPDIDRIDVSARLLTGDRDPACRIVSRAMGQAEAGDPFWLKALAFCQSISGADAAAALSLDLLAETDQAGPAFGELLDALASPQASKPIDLKGPKQPDAVFVAAAVGAGARLPQDWAKSGPVWLARAIASAPGQPMGLRLIAAERALAAGAIPASDVRELYRETAQDDATKSPKAAAQIERALAFQVAAAVKTDMQKADVVVQAIEASRQSGLYIPTAHIYSAILEQIAPALPLMDRARTLVPALLVGESSESAGAWMAFPVEESDFNSAALAAIVSVSPYLALLSPTPGDTNNIDLWSARETPDLAEQAAFVVTTLDALGDQVPAALADAASAAKTEPGSRTGTQGLQTESEGRSKSDGALLLSVLETLGAAPPEAWQTTELANALRKLRESGFADEARLLALEAAAARGL